MLRQLVHDHGSVLAFGPSPTDEEVKAAFADEDIDTTPRMLTAVIADERKWWRMKREKIGAKKGKKNRWGK